MEMLCFVTIKVILLCLFCEQDTKKKNNGETGWASFKRYKAIEDLKVMSCNNCFCELQHIHFKQLYNINIKKIFMPELTWKRLVPRV